MKSVNSLCGQLKQFAGDNKTVSEGQTIYRYHCEAERYLVDFADNFTAEGWMQFDTDQDASYYGVWVNPKTLQQLSYAEGDWCLVEANSKEAYNAMIDELLSFHQPAKYATAYDFEAKTMTEIFQPRDCFKAV